MTRENESKKNVYNKLIFVEFIEFLCRILYTRFSIDLDSNLLGPGFSKLTQGQDKTKSAADSSKVTDSSQQTRKKMEPDEKEKQE